MSLGSDLTQYVSLPCICLLLLPGAWFLHGFRGSERRVSCLTSKHFTEFSLHDFLRQESLLGLPVFCLFVCFVLFVCFLLRSMVDKHQVSVCLHLPSTEERSRHHHAHHLYLGPRDWSKFSCLGSKHFTHLWRPHGATSRKLSSELDTGLEQGSNFKKNSKEWCIPHILSNLISP